MVNYYVISKNEKAVGQGGETLYGVCACTLHDGVMEVQNCIYGISGDLAWLKTLRGTAERRLIIESLNNLRSRLIAAGRFTDAVDELLLKFVNAKVKKFKVIHTV